MAEPTIEELKAKEERLKAEAALLRAQADLLNAQTEYDAVAKARENSNASDGEGKIRLDAQTARLKAIKAHLDAKREADLAEAQAELGSVSGSGVTGSVTAGSEAGKGEGTLLAARAMIVASTVLVEKIADKVAARPVLLMSGVEGAQFSNYRQFLLHRAVIERVLEQAINAAENVLGTVGDRKESPSLEMAPATTIGAGLEIATKLGSYFATEYTVGGLTVSTDTEQFLSAVADSLLARGKAVILPNRRVPPNDEFIKVIETLAVGIKTAEAKFVELGRTASGLKEASTREQDAAKKERLLQRSSACDQPAVVLRNAIDKAEGFIAGLMVADPKGVSLLARIAQEKIMSDQLNAGAVNLNVDVRSLVGGYYSKKNLWTFLGSMPFFAMGGGVAVYYLTDGTGKLLGSGLIAIHSGYTKVSAVPDLVNPQPLDTSSR